MYIKKINVLVVVVFMLVTSLVIVPEDIKVKASGGSGDIDIDYDFIYNVTENLSKIIFLENGEDNGIAKGRAFGTNGEQHAAGLMEDYLVDITNNLDKNIYYETIGNESAGYTNLNKMRNVNNKLIVKGYGLKLKEGGNGDPIIIRNKESFPFPKFIWLSPQNVSTNGWYEVRWAPFVPESDDPLIQWTSYLKSYELFETNGHIIDGMITYIQNYSNATSEEKADKIHLINVTNGEFNNTIDTLEECNASGFIIRRDDPSSIIDWNINISGVSLSEDDWDFVYNLTQNGTAFATPPDEDPIPQTGLLNITHINSTESCCMDKYIYLINTSWARNNWWWFLNFWHKVYRHRCVGYIFSDGTYPDTHFMFPFAATQKTPASLNNYYSRLVDPIISINGSIWINGQETNFVDWVDDNLDTENSVYADLWINTDKDSEVVSYNVICDINGTDASRNIIIGAHYEGWWSQSTIDNAVGVGQALGILKYMNEINITPKCNVRFIFFGGHEYAIRGSLSHVLNESNEQYLTNTDLMINLDQLGHNTSPSRFRVNATRLVWISILNKIFDYTGHPTEYNPSKDYTISVGGKHAKQFGMVDAKRFGESKYKIKYINFCKDNFFEYHQSGINHNKGDVMDVIDQDDLNLTTEFIWNVTKYFTINPNCWFSFTNHTFFDSTSDNNAFNDSVNVTFQVNTSLPSDKITIRTLLKCEDFPFKWYKYPKDVSYVISKTQGINTSVVTTLPSLAPKGNYSLHVYLFNSTGKIKNSFFSPKNIYFNDNLSNDSYEPMSTTEDYISMHPLMDPPNTPTMTNQNTNVDAGRKYAYTATTTDPNGDQICYQFQYGNSSGYEYTTFQGYYNSGQSCTDNYMWTDDGSTQVRARARDESGSPNVWSEWSNPLNVNVNPGLSVDGPTIMVLNESSQFNCTAYGFSLDDADFLWEFSWSDGSKAMQKHTYDIRDPAHQFNFSGDYNNVTLHDVNLTVEDTLENLYYYNFTADVVCVASDFNTNSQGCVQPNVTLNFTDMSTVFEEHTIANWTWNFGDDNTSWDQSPSHNYSVDGSYNVTLNATDNESYYHVNYQIVHIDSVGSDVIAAPVSSSTEMIISGAEFPIYGSFYDDRSGISTVNISIDYPDGSSKNFTMSSNTSNQYDRELILTSDDTIQVGQLNYTVWTSDRSGNLNKSTERYFTVLPILGGVEIGSLNKSVEDNITGSKFWMKQYGEADSITAYINGQETGAAEYQCMLYDYTGTPQWTRIGTTETESPNATGWVTFNINGTKPVLNENEEYLLTIWGNNSNATLFYDNASSPEGRYNISTYDGSPSQYPGFTSENRLYSIYCNYTPDTVPPEITSISDSPDPVGIGCNITIQATVIDSVADVDTVKVSISDVTGLTSGTTDNMTNTEGDTYQYVFNNTWKIGQYNYTITAQDKSGNPNTTSTYSFDVTSYANLTISTIYDDYAADQYVNITDPPICDGSTQMVWYELLDNSSVLNTWNKYDSYFFNTSSGIQLTNHYDEYWSRNVLMLGYYNNDEWNLIYRTDELSGFNKNIETDNKTYVNVTLWKNLSYNGYDFRLAIRYHLGMDDKDLTIVPYIKAYEDIPYVLGFAWEIKDIQIDMTEEYDYIEINDTMYYLNTSLDETYTELEDPVFYIRENMSDTTSESLYLKWNNSLNYKVQVKSRDGQYNAPVTLAIRIGTLDENQSKHTRLFWHDASEITYYFNGYDKNEAWATNPGNMVNGLTSFYASTTAYDSERCDSNNCSGSDLGDISNVKLRVHGYYWGTQADISLFGIYDDEYCEEDEYVYVTPPSAAWSDWFDITDDTFAPDPWDWEDIKHLGVLVKAEGVPLMHTLYCSKVELRVTYTPNTGPDADNPHPASGTMGISLPYTLLNITVTDVNNDTMNVTWYTNRSGNWQSFATNNSVANNTVIQQNYTNLTENGKWWYWKVNVTDGTNYSESPVYSFYTGYQSKIENTGSTDIKGYLLMQVHFYNSTSEEWVVDDDTINESTIRTISDGGELGLDSIFNGEVYTGGEVSGDLLFGYGTYRVYAVFRDPNGNILETSYGNKLEGWYEFEYSNSKV